MLENGVRVSNYVIEGRIGDGGMATVYRVKHVILGTLHALKVLDDRYRAMPEVRQRFLDEARVGATTDHPNIIKVTEIVATGDVAGIVMELVEGQTLEEYINELAAPPPAQQVRALFLPVLAGVEELHRRGIIHRDIKPANILLKRDGRGGFCPKVTDFGIAKVGDALGTDPQARKKATGVDAEMGTWSYMSPEQIRSPRDVTVRSDVFSLGATLYELATKKLAFDGDGKYDIMERIVHGRYVPPERVAPIDPAIAAAIKRSLQPDPRQRFGSCAEFRAALERTSRGSAFPAGWVLAAAGAVAAIGGGIYLWPTTAQVTIESNPPGAAVFDDSDGQKALGTTPLTAIMRRGRHELALKLKDYQDDFEDVHIKSGEQKVSIALHHVRPNILEFKADPDTIYTGHSTTLKWDANYADACLVGGGQLRMGPKDSAQTKALTTGAAASKKQFDLKCIGPGGETAQQTWVTVLPSPIKTFAVDAEKIVAGEQTVLRWIVANKDVCAVKDDAGWSEGLRFAEGKLPVTPRATTTYTLTCDGQSESRTVTVTPRLKIERFGPDHREIVEGRSAKLLFEISNAGECWIIEGKDRRLNVDLSRGDLVVSPREDTTYVLHCTGAGGQEVQSDAVEIRVASPPQPPPQPQTQPPQPYYRPPRIVPPQQDFRPPANFCFTSPRSGCPLARPARVGDYCPCTRRAYPQNIAVPGQAGIR